MNEFLPQRHKGFLNRHELFVCHLSIRGDVALLRIIDLVQSSCGARGQKTQKAQRAV